LFDDEVDIITLVVVIFLCNDSRS